jgi:hypothetical protein
VTCVTIWWKQGIIEDVFDFPRKVLHRYHFLELLFPRVHPMQPKENNNNIRRWEDSYSKQFALYAVYFTLAYHLIELHISAVVWPTRISKLSGSNTSIWPTVLMFLYFSYHFRMNSRLPSLNCSVYLPIHCCRVFIQNHPFISFEISHVNPVVRKLTQNGGNPTLPSVVSCWRMVTRSIYRLYTKCSDVKSNMFRFNLFFFFVGKDYR